MDSSPCNIKEELHKHNLFSRLTPEQMDEIERHSRVRHMTEGERLFSQGQHAEHFFRLCSGQVKLYRLSMEGAEHVIEIIQPGQPFAEAVMFMVDQRYPVNAEALTECYILAIESAPFLRILEQSRETCFGLMGDMSQRLHMFVNEIDSLTLQNATFRLVHYLLQQVSVCKEPNMNIELDISKQIIASRLSIKPETFSRILKNLNDHKLLKVNGRTIQIMDVEGLRSFEQ